MFYKIVSIAPLQSYKLIICFEGSFLKQCDMLPLIRCHKKYFSLHNEMLFSSIKVAAGGYGVSWNDSIEMSSSELWNISTDFILDIEQKKHDFIANIVELRKKQGISQKQLEFVSGIKQPGIARIEKGLTDPQLSTLLRLLKPLGKTIGIIPLD